MLTVALPPVQNDVIIRSGNIATAQSSIEARMVQDAFIITCIKFGP